MELRDYLKSTTQEELARRLGVSQGTISHWVTGRVRVPAERCRAIELAVGGAVTVHELRPDLFDPPPPPSDAPGHAAAPAEERAA
jgi:DNA-binding transcriptional regulator YdaS (Cro superfamily)